MKKEFKVSIDITMAIDVTIKAENEAQAKSMVRDKMSQNPYEWAYDADRYVGYEIVDVWEG